MKHKATWLISKLKKGLIRVLILVCENAALELINYPLMKLLHLQAIVNILGLLVLPVDNRHTDENFLVWSLLIAYLVT